MFLQSYSLSISFKYFIDILEEKERMFCWFQSFEIVLHFDIFTNSSLALCVQYLKATHKGLSSGDETADETGGKFPSECNERVFVVLPPQDVDRFAIVESTERSAKQLLPQCGLMR